MDACTIPKEKANQACGIHRHGDEQGGFHGPCLSIYVGLGLDEEAGHLGVLTLTCGQQRAAGELLAVDIGLGCEERCGNVDVLEVGVCRDGQGTAGLGALEGFDGNVRIHKAVQQPHSALTGPTRPCWALSAHSAPLGPNRPHVRQFLVLE